MSTSPYDRETPCTSRMADESNCWRAGCWDQEAQANRCKIHHSDTRKLKAVKALNRAVENALDQGITPDRVVSLFTQALAAFRKAEE